MAEALFNHLGQGHIDAVSAGSAPAGYVHPQSIVTLQRHGIDPGQPASKSWDMFNGKSFDFIVTVCDAAAAESCPVFAGPAQNIHWPTPDPAKATGTQAEIEAAFDTAFMLLKTRIGAFIADNQR